MNVQPSIIPPDQRPLLLLDIDGVINLPARRPAVPFRSSSLTWNLPLETREHLQELQQVYWIVWCSEAARLLDSATYEVLGLNRRPAILPTPSETRLRDWKTAAIVRSLSGWNGPLAWVQDGFFPEALNWARARTIAGSPTLLLDVTASGLDVAITRQLTEWAGDVCRVLIN